MSVRALVGRLLQLDTNYVEMLPQRKGVCVTGVCVIGAAPAVSEAESPGKPLPEKLISSFRLRFYKSAGSPDRESSV